MPPQDSQITANRFRFLAEAAAWRYRAQGLLIRGAVRGKILREPFYRALLTAIRLPMEGTVIDLGCGRGVLLAYLHCAHSLGMAGFAKRGAKMRLLGIELDAGLAQSAKMAMAEEAEVITGDIRSACLPPLCRMAILQDVLLFLEPEEQTALLRRVAEALEPGGFIILKEPDAGAFGYRTCIRLAGDAFGLLYANRKTRLFPRRGEEWKSLLEAAGLQVESVPLDCGKWFADSLLLALK